MAKKDITIIFLTLNLLPEKWQQYHKEKLLEAADGAPIISVSRLPMDLGTNIIQSEPSSAVNIYWQTFRAAKLVKTPYFAIAEDDTLYPKQHFHSYRPSLDTFAYNRIRWGLFTWRTEDPIYYWTPRFSHMTLLAPTKEALDAFEERFTKFPYKGDTPANAGGELGKEKVEKRLGVKPRKYIEFQTEDPILYMMHTQSIDPLNNTMKKRMTPLRAYDIPVWGKAKDMLNKYL